MSASLRRRLLAQRDSLTPQQRALASRAITDHVWPYLDGMTSVASFVATRNEVDLCEVHERLLARGTTLAFPRVVGEGEMVLASVANLDELRPGAYGILEPTEDAIDWDDFDAVLVPGVAFDAAGGRIGFGKGFYDRAMARIREVRSTTLFIGVAYDFQVVESLTQNPWDQPVDVVITESGPQE